MRFVSGQAHMNIPSINDLHDEALIQEFVSHVGKRVLIITPSFPYIYIGKIEEVIEDHLVMDVNVTMIAELENRKWYIHIHQIETFYIEKEGKPAIPELKDHF